MPISTHTCQFPPTQHFLMVIWQFFHQAATFTFCSQCLTSTFQYLLWPSCSTQSLVVPTRRMVFLLTQICDSLRGWYLVNELTAKILHSNRWKAVLVLSSLKDYFLWLLHCFGIFWTISDIVFKADILPTCYFSDLSETQVSLASQTLSVFVTAPIAYRIQVLEAIMAAVQKHSGLWD